jgi:mRNA interferase MazF
MSLIPKRYEIYLAELSPTVGAEISKVRPVVVISQNEMNRNLETIVICPLTSQLHPQWQGRLQVTCAGKSAEIAVDQIRTVSKSRLRKKLDQLSPAVAAQLRRLITQMYGE